MDKQWLWVTQKQKGRIQLLKQYGSQEEVARKLKISQPAVSRSLSAGAVKQLHETEQSLFNALSLLGSVR